MKRTITTFCDFCGKHEEDVALLIAGPEVHICDVCSRICVDIVEGRYGDEPLRLDETY